MQRVDELFYRENFEGRLAFQGFEMGFEVLLDVLLLENGADLRLHLLQRDALGRDAFQELDDMKAEHAADEAAHLVQFQAECSRLEFQRHRTIAGERKNALGILHIRIFAEFLDERGKVLTVLNLDSVPPQALLDELLKDQDISNVKVVTL